MIKKPITIQLASGLEPRPVAVLVQVASQYNSTTVRFMWKMGTAKSMQRVLWE